MTWSRRLPGPWGTHVMAMESLSEHERLDIEATSTVERTPSSTTSRRWTGRRPGPRRPGPQLQWLMLSPRTSRRDRRPRRGRAGSRRHEPRPGSLPASCREMRYERGITGVHSRGEGAWVERAGVCQDFAHITVGALRSLGVPARYVSGYLVPRRRHGGGDQHGREPRVGRVLGQRVGRRPDQRHRRRQRPSSSPRRDYEDVPPFKGIYSGRARLARGERRHHPAGLTLAARGRARGGIAARCAPGIPLTRHDCTQDLRRAHPRVQMNVHDSSASPACSRPPATSTSRACPRPSAPRSPTSSSSTPAPSARTPTTSSTATSAACGPPRQPASGIAVGGCMAEGPRDDRHALGRRGLRHPQHRQPPPCSTVRGTTSGPRSRSSSRSRPSRRPCRPGATRPSPAGCRSRWAATTPARSASSRACAARSRTVDPARCSPRSRPSSRRGVVEITLLGQNVNTYGVEFGDRLAFEKLLRACGEVEGLEQVLPRARTRRRSPTTSSPRWPRRPTSCRACTCRCSPAPTAC